MIYLLQIMQDSGKLIIFYSNHVFEKILKNDITTVRLKFSLKINEILLYVCLLVHN